MLGLQLTRDQIRCSREDRSLLNNVMEQAGAALGELRELAAGIHALILSSRLRAAVKGLSRRSALPVTVSTAIPDRLPEAVEANVYFPTAEALTNAVKQVRATRITVSMNCDGETHSVQIQDDGIGGATLEPGGTGLKGIADRATVLGGRHPALPRSERRMRANDQRFPRVGGSIPDSRAGSQDRDRQGHPAHLCTGDRQVHHRPGAARLL